MKDIFFLHRISGQKGDVNLNDDENKWRQRDWKWLVGIVLGIVGILILVIIWVLSYRLSDNKDIVNIISIGAGLVSIVLGIVAIIISSIQNNSTQKINMHIEKAIGIMGVKIDNVNEKINYRVTDPSTNTEEISDIKPIDITKEDLKNKYTRIHAIIQMQKTFNSNMFLRTLSHILEQQSSSLVDYSIGSVPTFSINFINAFLVIRNSFSQESVEGIILAALNNSMNENYKEKPQIYIGSI